MGISGGSKEVRRENCSTKRGCASLPPLPTRGYPFRRSGLSTLFACRRRKATAPPPRSGAGSERKDGSAAATVFPSGLQCEEGSADGQDSITVSLPPAPLPQKRPPHPLQSAPPPNPPPPRPHP